MEIASPRGRFAPWTHGRHAAMGTCIYLSNELRLRASLQPFEAHAIIGNNTGERCRLLVEPANPRAARIATKIGEEAAARAGADKYQDLAILNRIASARFGWQPRFFNPRLERWLHRVNVPTHVIWGDGDRIIPPVYAE